MPRKRADQTAYRPIDEGSVRRREISLGTTELLRRRYPAGRLAHFVLGYLSVVPGSRGKYRVVARAASIVVALVALLLFILTSCPSNRDGMPGQLAAAKEEMQSAARSAALSLTLWSQGRSTQSLISVQLADARDEVVNAYRGIAVLKAEDPVDVGRQRLLTDAMTDLIGKLNSAGAGVRAVPGQPDPLVVRQELLDRVDALETEYR